MFQNIQSGEKTKEDSLLYQLKLKVMEVLKQVAGIYVAQKELVITFGRMYEDLSVELYAYKVFKNTKK